MSAKKINKNYQTIQALRFIAAAAVALTHITFYMKTRIDSSIPLWSAGSQGVQVFFVISGFVMAYSSGFITNSYPDWRLFFKRRLVRIVPLYWIMNFVKLLILIIIPSSLLAKPDILNVLLSLVFIPSRNGDGIIETFYGVGWTLNFEIFFYSLITLCLFFRRSIFIFTTIALTTFILIGSFRQDNWPAVFYLFHPYLANFIWGLIIAKIATKTDANKPILGLVLVVISAYYIFIEPIHPTMQIFGVQYAALVLGFICLEDRLRERIPKLIIFCGDASYSIYLTHAMTGPVAVIFANIIGIDVPLIIAVFAFFVVIFGSILCFIFIERPITKALTQKILHSQN